MPGSAVAHLTVDQRVARGKALRAEVPRSAHATLEAPANRADPIDLLEAQARTRIPELVPIRYGRMLVSPFAFYRGAAKVMAYDLANTPRSGLDVQCCGDAHVANFGVFASPERRLVFDINDFDETLPGPWEWDVKRLAASIVIAARERSDPARDQRRLVLAAVGQYRAAMRDFAGMTNLAVWYAHVEIDGVVEQFAPALGAGEVERTEAELRKARTRERLSEFSKLAREVDGRVQIVDHSPLVVPVRVLAPAAEAEQLLDSLHGLLRSYRHSLEDDRRVLLEQFELADFARKVVGVGSVGTRAWIALLLGRDHQDPLFLQLKEAEESVLEEHLGAGGRGNHGRRVVRGQRLMQESSDIFLGWLHVDAGVYGPAGDFYGRQLKDWKGAAEIERMTPKSMAAYGRLCAWTLARAHARSGDRIAIASYLGGGTTFDKAIVEFSEAYADQNERDYEALVEAVKSGRITAQTGV